MTALLLIGFGLFLVGSLCLGGAYLFYRNTARFRRGSIATEGVVCEFKIQTDSEGDAVYHPIFRYRARTGHEYTICSDTGTNPPGFKKGQSVGIFYNPDKPTEARIDTFVQLWLAPVVLSVLGVFLWVVGIILIVISIKDRV